MDKTSDIDKHALLNGGSSMRLEWQSNTGRLTNKVTLVPHNRIVESRVHAGVINSQVETRT
eukprot:2105370-Amphidinium_carterae.1